SHIVPGAVAFGGLMALAVTSWLRDRETYWLILVAATLATAAGLYWGLAHWIFLVRTSVITDGWMPIGPKELLLTWVPLAGLAVNKMARFALARNPPHETSATSLCLMTALLTAGALQVFVYLRMTMSGTLPPYAVKSLSYYTFPLATLLGVIWLAGWLPGRL